MTRYLRTGDNLRVRAGVLADHGVALLLSSAWGSDLTDAERQTLRSEAEPYLTASLRAQALAADLSPLLAEAGVRHVVIKGPALGARWREAFGVDARTFTDLDLLVKSDDLHTVRGICRGLGLAEGGGSGG